MVDLDDPEVLENILDHILANDKFLDKLHAKLRERDNDFLVFSFRDVATKGENGYEVKYRDPLAREVCEALGKEPGKLTFDRFLNGEGLFTLEENVRRKDCYIIFDPDPEKDIDGEIMRFLYVARTIKTSHARNITAVMPCAPYSRQDQLYGKRQLVTARYIADLLHDASVNHVITIGLHSPQIEGFHNSIDHLKTRPIFSHYIEQRSSDLRGCVELLPEYEKDPQTGLWFLRRYATLISPDAGGMRSTNELRRDIDPEREIDVGFVQKERVGVNVAESGKVVGNVEGKVVIIYDDILDTAGTLFNGAKAVKEHGARYVIACIDHALANSNPGGPTFAEKLAASHVDELIVTNTKPEIYDRVANGPLMSQKMTVLSVAPLLKEAILRDRDGSTIRDVVEQVGKENLYRILHQGKRI